MTRSQKHMALAAACIDEVSKEKHDEVSRIYGGLCHSFPVMVRTCGLCQTMAFHAAKAAGSDSRANAHRLLLKHAAQILDVPPPGDGDSTPTMDAVRNMPVTAYMAKTRAVLEAWIFFKRFAASVLDVHSPQLAEQGGDGGNVD